MRNPYLSSINCGDLGMIDGGQDESVMVNLEIEVCFVCIMICEIINIMID